MQSVLAEPEKVITEQKVPKNICFVCTGNTCRSPMAQAVLNALGKGRYNALSAGISAFAGDPIAENAVLALRAAGIENTPENDYEHHTATPISEELIERCEKIVAMSGSHYMALILHYPQYADRFSVMDPPIPDPFMQGETVYRECLDLIIKGIKEMFCL